MVFLLCIDILFVNHSDLASSSRSYLPRKWWRWFSRSTTWSRHPSTDEGSLRKKGSCAWWRSKEPFHMLYGVSFSIYAVSWGLFQNQIILKMCKKLLRLSETDGYVEVNLTVVAIPSILLCDEMRTPVLQMMWTRTMLPCHHYCLRRLAPKHWVNISDQRKVSVQPHPCPDPWHSPSLNRSTCMFNSI